MPASHEQAQGAPAAEDYLPELTAVVAHDINNVLNNIVLQAAILEAQAPRLAAPLAIVTHLGNDAARMLRRLQHLCLPPEPPAPLDVNRMVRETASRFAAVRLDLAPDLPPAQGTEAGLRRLLGLLLLPTTYAAPTGGTALVRSQASGRHVLLRVEDTGPPLTTNELERLFEPFAVTRPGGGGWELAACKGLARRMRATIHGERSESGGLAMTVEMQQAD